MDEDNRRSILLSLLELDRPIVELQAMLGGLDWDYPKALVTLTQDHIRRVLERFKTSTIPATTIEAWAELIECRDDIEYQDQATNDAIFVLANPHLHGQLDEARRTLL